MGVGGGPGRRISCGATELLDGALPDGHAGFYFLKVPATEVEGGGAVLGADPNQDGGLGGGDEAEAMLEEDLVGSVVLLALGDEFSEHAGGHGKVGGVVDASDFLVGFQLADDAEEAHLRTEAGAEGGGDIRNGIGGEEERGHETGILYLRLVQNPSGAGNEVGAEHEYKHGCCGQFIS